jgi:hypothetical protein
MEGPAGSEGPAGWKGKGSDGRRWGGASQEWRLRRQGNPQEGGEREDCSLSREEGVGPSPRAPIRSRLSCGPALPVWSAPWSLLRAHRPRVGSLREGGLPGCCTDVAQSATPCKHRFPEVAARVRSGTARTSPDRIPGGPLDLAGPHPGESDEGGSGRPGGGSRDRLAEEPSDPKECDRLRRARRASRAPGAEIRRLQELSAGPLGPPIPRTAPAGRRGPSAGSPPPPGRRP